MNHIKSTISRSLRRNSPAVLTFRARRSAVRNIASTSRSATSLDVRNSEPQPSPTVFYSRNTSVLPSTMVKQPVDGFTRLVTSLTHALTRPTSPPSVPELIRIMAAYDSDEPSWERFAIGDESKQYTRNLVIEVPGVFNLLMLVWSPGKASPIHDHVDSHCVM
ncbi:RmlC-like cupin domain-containing protein [Bisporella sp. PMI_857]|nr:RmlC-like cupin domain-containing protein [Bisporella sp. PMI_857]